MLIGPNAPLVFERTSLLSLGRVTQRLIVYQYDILPSLYSLSASPCGTRIISAHSRNVVFPAFLLPVPSDMNRQLKIKITKVEIIHNEEYHVFIMDGLLDCINNTSFLPFYRAAKYV